MSCWWLIKTIRLSCKVMEMRGLKDFRVTILTLWVTLRHRSRDRWTRHELLPMGGQKLGPKLNLENCFCRKFPKFSFGPNFLTFGGFSGEILISNFLNSQMAHPCVGPGRLIEPSLAKIRPGVWPVGEMKQKIILKEYLLEYHDSVL